MRQQVCVGGVICQQVMCVCVGGGEVIQQVVCVCCGCGCVGQGVWGVMLASRCVVMPWPWSTHHAFRIRHAMVTWPQE